MKDEILVNEDINAFWKNLGSRNKLFTVKIGKKVYKNMEMVYTQEGENGLESFKFIGSDVHGRKK